MRERKKHWLGGRAAKGPWEVTWAVCGTIDPKHYATAKRKVTCKRCLKSMGMPT